MKIMISEMGKMVKKIRRNKALCMTITSIFK